MEKITVLLASPDRYEFIRRYSLRHEVKAQHRCWAWLGSYFANGYGRIKFKGKVYRAHRVAYTLVYGEIPAGKIIMHRCDNPGCVNPGHLRAGTHKENQRDSIRKGRNAAGDRHWTRQRPDDVLRAAKHGRSKLTWNDVHQIRSRFKAGETVMEIKQDFPVDWSTIKRVVTHETWSRT